MRSVLAALALSLAGLSCTPRSMNERAYPGPVVGADRHPTACTADADCVLVATQPCSCDCELRAAGLAAIHRADEDRHARAYESARAGCGWSCDTCSQAPAPGASPAFAAACERNACAVRDAAPATAARDGRDAATTCAVAARRLARLATRDLSRDDLSRDDIARTRRRLLGEILGACETDAWPEETRRCAAAAGGREDHVRCKTTLAPEASARLERRIDATLGGAGGGDRVPAGGSIPACNAYIARIREYAQCSALPAPAREAIEQSIEMMSEAWSEIDDAPDHMRVAAADACAQASEALEQAMQSLGC